jgi:hypothetical protein
MESGLPDGMRFSFPWVGPRPVTSPVEMTSSLWNCRCPNKVVISTGAYPDFLPRCIDRAACAPFRKEGRMKCINANKPHRKSGVA